MSNAALVQFANVSALTGVIVGQKLATLYELQTVYNLEDALNLLEVVTVQNYNSWAVHDEQQRNR